MTVFSEWEPPFLLQQPFFWPLVAHAIAMSIVIWNPLLFFWLTKTKKRPRLASSLSGPPGAMLSRISTTRMPSILRSIHTSISAHTSNIEPTFRKTSIAKSQQSVQLITDTKNCFAIEREQLI
ncbi:unnamed protein product [Thelazia callipaeda]|uniref:G-protein coupled receptors family 1 profile domain-containing protein n=1 Tax=Thelazia callipaeda TaxID=103827 RepID=A0A0N5CT43_THECL|nr:unnamed protein product [Thelazia callipaeda]